MILHIPHSSTNIPLEDTTLTVNQEDINLLTDWFTDELFSHPYSSRVVFPYSRLFCDVERYRDNYDEPMFKKGHGVVYTKGTTGNTIRTSNKFESHIKEKYYDIHHTLLNIKTNRHLSLFNEVVIVDCHSFHYEKLQHEDSDLRPDFCLGFNEDLPFLNDLVNIIKSNGYSVELNNPFSGALVPISKLDNHYVKGIMIEVNRKLYLDDKYNKNNNFDSIKSLITKLLDVISVYEVSRG